MKIPFNKAYLTGKEQEYIEDALQRREISGDGYYTEKVTNLLKQKFSLSHLLMTTSGTHALEMAADLIDLNDDDEVIMPSYTFSSTANAVMKTGAKPVFCEVNGETFNIDPAQIEKHINKNTRAVIPVHYGGIACDMDKIMELADKYNLYVIEDAAQGVNSKYKGEYLGSIGDFGCYSFHGSKNYVCGEGGALCLNNDDKNILKKAEILREKGTNRSQFKRGHVDKYSWKEVGSSYLPSDLLMAVLYAQLQELDYIKGVRENIHEFYLRNLKGYLSEDFLDNITLVPETSSSNYHIFYLKFSRKNIRNYVLKKLKEKDISAAFHYIPLHASPMGQKLGYKKDDFKITNEIADTILRLPLYPDLRQPQLEYIIHILQDIFQRL